MLLFNTISKLALASGALVIGIQQVSAREIGSDNARSAAAQDSPSQDNSSPPPTSSTQQDSNVDGAIDDNVIVVTAQRRSQKLQDVPLAVSSFSAQQLDAQQIGQTLDIVPYIPNATAQHNTGPGTANAYFIRGLGSADTSATFDPPVGIYVDDLFVARQAANNFAFFDVERVEVLRGPQGTLFGRNTTGGAIRVLLRKPSEEFGGKLSASYGRFDRMEFRGTVDLPISDDVLTKFSGYYIDDSGFVTNRVLNEPKTNEETNWGVRAAVRLKPASMVVWDLAADYINNSRANNLNFKDADGKRFTLTGLPLAGGTLLNPFSGAPLLTGDKNNSKTGNTAKTFSATSKFSIDLGDDQIEIMTGYLRTKDDLLVDIFNGGFGAPGDQIPESQISLPPGLRGSFSHSTGGFTFGQFAEHDQFTQEIKVNGERFGGKLNYVVGGYYFREDNVTDLGQVFTVPSGFPLVLVDSNYRNETESFAVYGQIDYEILNGLNLTAGVRATDETKTIRFFDNQPLGNITDITTANVIALDIPTKQKTNLVTPRLAATYTATPDINVFVSATRGFKSGGWNASGTSAFQLVPFGPEKVWSYEAGVRSQWFDRRLTLNLTGFISDVTDYQVLTAIPNGPGAFANVVRNFADLQIKGLEFETALNISSDISLFANVGYQDAKYIVDPNAPIADEFGIISVAEQQRQCLAAVRAACDRGIITATGTIAEPTRVPKLSGSTGYRVALPFDSLSGKFTHSAALQFFTDNFRGTSNTPLSASGDVGIINAGIGFEADTGWSANLSCQNCFDRSYTISQLGVFAFINDPMRWSFTINVPFGSRTK